MGLSHYPNNAVDKQLEQYKIDALEAKVGLSIGNVREPLLMLLANTDFSRFERRIYWWILAEYNKAPFYEGRLKTTFKISVKDLVQTITEAELEIAEIHNRKVNLPKRTEMYGKPTNYRYYKDLCYDIIKRTVQIDKMDADPRKRTVGHINIFQAAFYREGNIYVEVSHIIADILADLSKGYSKYQLKAALLMRSNEAQIVYVRCCRFLDSGWWDVSLEEFKTLIRATQYDRYSNFKQRVLLPILNEINSRSDLFIYVDEIKKGRSVDRLRFSIKYFVDALAEENAEEKKDQARLNIKQINTFSLEERVRHAKNILSIYYPRLNAKLKDLVLMSEKHLNKFIEVDVKIQEQAIVVKKGDRTAYMAAALREVSKRRKIEKIAPDNELAISFENQWPTENPTK